MTRILDIPDHVISTCHADHITFSTRIISPHSILKGRSFHEVDDTLWRRAVALGRDIVLGSKMRLFRNLTLIESIENRLKSSQDPKIIGRYTGE